MTFWGCASTTLPAKRDVITQIQVERVEVPVPVPCVAIADIPAKPTIASVDVKIATLKQLAAAMSAYVLELTDYAARAEIVMMQCAGTATSK